MAVKNYIRLDKIGSDARLASVAMEAELLAGQFVNLGAVLEDAEGEVVEATKAEAGKKADALVCPVYLDKGYPDFDITTQSIAAGKAARALHPEAGQIVSFNAENAAGLKAGDKVTVGANGLGVKKAGESDEAIGTVISLEYLSNIGDLVVVRF